LAKLQEYDLEVNPLKVVKGQELCKLMTGIEAINIYSLNTSGAIIQSSSLTTCEWYKDIIFYLNYSQFPVEMSHRERRSLKMKTNQYVY
jgi:hypothetical protein